jgi:DNA mismatch repair protein MutS
MKTIAEIDVSSTMALLALENGYVRPNMVSESRVIDVKGGRHPVIEKILFDRNMNVRVNLYSFFFC